MSRHRAPTGLGRGRVSVRGVLVGATVVLALAVAPAAQAGPWTRPAVLAGPIPAKTYPDRLPVVAVNRHGQTLVAWATDYRRYRGVSVAIGTRRGRFGRAVRVSPTGIVRAAAIADDGTAIVLWDDHGIVASVRPSGGRFGHAQRLSGTQRGQAAVPVVAVDRASNVLVGWTRLFRAGATTVTDVQVVYRPARGRFGAASTIGSGALESIVFNARGDAVASWLNIVESGGTFPVPYTRTAVAQVAVRPAGGRFGPPATVSTTPTWDPSAVLTDEATVGAIWEQANGPESDPYGPIRTSTQVIGGAVEAPVDVPMVSARRAFNPRIFYGSRGELVALWQEKTHSTPFSRAAPLHWATRTPGGAFGARQTVTATEADLVQFAPTGNGRALVIWTDTQMRAALYRSTGGFVVAAAPPARPARVVTRALAAAGGYAAFVWQQAGDGRLLVSVRQL